jgi:hypothetical protein
LSYIEETAMARMIRTIISLPAEVKQWLDAYGERHAISSAQVVRLAIRDLQSRTGEGTPPGAKGVREGRAAYGPPAPPNLVDMAEVKRRAAAAAGRFASGVPDLSIDHDRYLAGEKPEMRPGPAEKDKERKARPAIRKGGRTG